jgi:5,6-dimethylbenzimidazole synthase
MPASNEPLFEYAFDTEARNAIYRAIFTRRDVRSHFVPHPVDDAVLARLLVAAHHGPSVGYVQPWNFIVIRDNGRREKVRDLQARLDEVQNIPADRQGLYRQLRLEGICESSLNLCVTCNRHLSRRAPLGRWHNPEMDLYSTVCAVQNLWLAARAEGIGIGWVSILEPAKLKQLLGIPDGVVPVAYLCLGHVSQFASRPDLETQGWDKRRSLRELVMSETFGGAGEEVLRKKIDGIIEQVEQTAAR